jgi:hypothetical protein
MTLIKLAYADQKPTQKLATTALNQQLLALISTNAEDNKNIKAANIKVNALIKEIKNLPTRPKSSGA